MKRILIAAAVAVLLAGCSQTHYPYLRYKNSDVDGDSKDRWIEVRGGHELSEGHSWDIVETNQGYDLVLHFVRTECGS
nr:MAG TPA: Prokaryotic membrane lipoprotein lipid attachment site [Caudoviricetes sp.]